MNYTTKSEGNGERRVCCTVWKVENERVAIDVTGSVASSAAVDAIVSR